MTPRGAAAGDVLDLLPIQRSTAGALAPLPAASSTAEFQKITQVVPVRVAITDPRGLPLLPGMNVTVRIHRG